jgi:AraC-like DNA-binding protein
MRIKKSDQECIELARDILLKNLRHHITIRELAERVRLSESKLKYTFKEMYGMGIYAYLSRARMEKAKELLEESDKSIKEIAMLTGYKRITSFIKVFRKIYDKSPAAWRRHQFIFFCLVLLLRVYYNVIGS